MKNNRWIVLLTLMVWILLAGCASSVVSPTDATVTAVTPTEAKGQIVNPPASSEETDDLAEVDADDSESATENTQSPATQTVKKVIKKAPQTSTAKKNEAQASATPSKPASTPKNNPAPTPAQPMVSAPVENPSVSFRQPDNTNNWDKFYVLAGDDIPYFSTVCTTYDDYVAFLDADNICLNTANTKDSLLALYPQTYFEQGNSLLFFYYHAGSGGYSSKVKDVTFANGVLNVSILSKYPAPTTTDYRPKLYFCELSDFSQPVDQLKVTVTKERQVYVNSGKDPVTKTETETYVYKD